MKDTIADKMDKCENRKYQQFRKIGYDPKEAKRAAIVLDRFEWLEYEGKVRMRAEPMQEDYFDINGKPEAYIDARTGRKVSARKAYEEIVRDIERLGHWIVGSQVWDEGRKEWRWVDSCGDFIQLANPISAFENPHVIDMMREAIAEAEAIEWEMDNDG